MEEGCWNFVVGRIVKGWKEELIENSLHKEITLKWIGDIAKEGIRVRRCVWLKRNEINHDKEGEP